MKMTVETIGGDALLKKFERLGDEADDVFKEVVDDTAIYMHSQAVSHINQNVKTGTGHLKQSMYFDLSGDDFALVGNRADYASYIEFGTGRNVQVPAEFAPIASKARSKSKKSFKEGLQAIRDWCVMRGIDVKLAYPIFMSILRDGVRPRPFMYPAYRKAIGHMAKESAKALNKLLKTK
jgi:HK97 gp10 family phage protein